MHSRKLSSQFLGSFWVSPAIFPEKDISLRGTVMTAPWPLPCSQLPMLPTSSLHSAPVNQGPLSLLPLCLECSYLSKACSLVQSWHKRLLEEAFLVLPLTSYVRFVSPCAGRGGSSSGNNNIQSQRRFLSAYYVPGLFCIRFTCTISFNPRYQTGDVGTTVMLQPVQQPASKTVPSGNSYLTRLVLSLTAQG